jgi:hypothetical protein
MELKGTLGKVADVLEKNIALLTVAGASYARMAEFSGSPLSSMVEYFTFKTGNPVSELLNSISSPDQLKYKLLESTHAYTQAFKAGLGVWAFTQLMPGIIPNKYGSIAGKVALGAGIAALVLPGSGPKPLINSGKVGTVINGAPTTNFKVLG